MLMKVLEKLQNGKMKGYSSKIFCRVSEFKINKSE